MKYFNILRNRGLALFMALVMCVSFLPTTARAADADSNDSIYPFTGGAVKSRVLPESERPTYVVRASIDSTPKTPQFKREVKLEPRLLAPNEMLSGVKELLPDRALRLATGAEYYFWIEPLTDTAGNPVLLGNTSSADLACLEFVAGGARTISDPISVETHAPKVKAVKEPESLTQAFQALASDPNDPSAIETIKSYAGIHFRAALMIGRPTNPNFYQPAYILGDSLTGKNPNANDPVYYDITIYVVAKEHQEIFQDIRTPKAELSITKNALVNGVAVTAETVAKAGDTITYTVTVTNSGNVALEDVAIEDEMMSEDDRTVGKLEAGAKKVITYTYEVQPSDAGTVVTNKAKVTGGNTDPAGPQPASKETEITVKVSSEYTITWQNDNGAVLATTKVKEGDTPVYPGSTPTKPTDFDGTTYTFTGWSPEVVSAAEDITYVAQYSSEKYIPTMDDVRELIEVVIECDNQDVDHNTAAYRDSDIPDESITILSDTLKFEDGVYTCEVQISSAAFVTRYNAAHGNVAHTPENASVVIELQYTLLATEEDEDADDEQVEAIDEGQESDTSADAEDETAGNGDETTSDEATSDEAASDEAASDETTSCKIADTTKEGGAEEEEEEEPVATMEEEASVVEEETSDEEDASDADSQLLSLGYSEGAASWTLVNPADGTVTFIVRCTTPQEDRTHTLSYNANGGVSAPDSQSVINKTDSASFLVSSQEPIREGYTFLGWATSANGTAAYQSGASITVSGTRTLYAVWMANTPVAPDTPDTPVTPTPTPVTPVPTTPDPVTPVIPVTPSYPTGGGTTTIPGGATPLAPTGTTINDGDVPLAAPGLNSTDHFDYIKGYSDGTVRPEASITRAEVATIFFRLMTNDFRTANWAAENDFSDVQSGDWYNNAVSTCAKAGILKGYTDGTFKPNDPITRAEFASIAASFASEEVPSGGMFSDIEGHWAQKSIERAAAAGWIKGSDGKFRPNDQITRAEVIVTVNRMLDRVPDAAYLLADMKTFSDNTPDKWYYADVQEATNSHDYERAEDGVTGIWTELLPEQDWTALEKEWAAAADANVVDVAEGLRSEEESSEDDAADDGE